MKRLRNILIVLAVMLGILTAAMVWLLLNFHIVGFRLYPKNVAVLDLRRQEISVTHYQKLAEKMPDTEIRWDVPFQGGTVAWDAEEITITTLSDRDVAVLDCLGKLKTVHAQDCTDYVQLSKLRQRRQEVDVDYAIHFTADRYHWSVSEVVLQEVRETDIPLLQYLPNLKTVALSGGGHDSQTVQTLREAAHNGGKKFGVVLGGRLYLDTETKLELEDVTDQELTLLPYLYEIRKLHLVNPAADPEAVFALPGRYPNADVTWEVELSGEFFDGETRTVDLSQTVVRDLEEIEQRMVYLPEAEMLILGLCGVDEPKWGNSKTKNLAVSEIENQELADYRNRVREDYKVVWTVRLGPSIALRTDADNFMPNHYGVGQLPDSYAYNLRYCEDMVCLDVGHMTLTDISFVEYMPKLKYLILAWTEVKYIEPIRTCKNLVFLELDNSCIRDYSPLVDCTALEDLNIGKTFCDITPVLEMTWLKNLWMIFGSGTSAYMASQALPDTHVVASGTATVGSGWRRLPNYYAMRDCLGVPYMN